MVSARAVTKMPLPAMLDELNKLITLLEEGELDPELCITMLRLQVGFLDHRLQSELPREMTR